MNQPDNLIKKEQYASLPLVAVVILNWNGKKYLQQFLPALMASTYPNKKIIVADNASTDDSVNFVCANFPSVEIICHTANEGFAKGYNTALKKVEADYFVLLNSDVEVTPGWIEPVVRLMEADKSIGACQPKIKAWQKKNYFEYAGAAGGWIDEFGYPFSRGRVFDCTEEDRGQYDDAAPCFWASGAALFVRSELYDKLRGLDEYFFAHQEEIDFCWRLQLAGSKVYVQPLSVVYHVGGGTLPKSDNRKVYLNFRNNLIMLAKNLPLSEAFWRLPVRLLLDAVAAWKGLLGGSPGYFWAVVKAHFHFVKWCLLDTGRSVFPVSKTGEVSGLYKGSIVWQHFVKKKKLFSEIVTGK